MSTLKEDQELYNAVKPAKSGVWDSAILKAYSKRKDSISLRNGSLFWGCTPNCPLRKTFVEELHLTH
uniref:Uncharacterized protein n=1 Tax=Lepeophtheirus salmonis TaxID=72036 RepID=A0A0K2UZN9_LEPSM